ncbi:MAG: TraM recognition domain-containing protein [Gammaproteobacteria bacterium]
MSNYLNITGHYDEFLLRTKQDHLIAIIKLSGLYGETKNPSELDQYKDLWSDLLTSIASANCVICFHVLQKIDEQYPEGGFAPGFARQLNEAYRKSHFAEPKYYQEYYLSIVHMPAKHEEFTRVFEHLSFNKKDREIRLHLSEAKKLLMDIVQRYLYALKIYQPCLLTVYKGPQGLASEPLEFINYLLNLNEKRVYLSEQDYSHILPAKRIYAQKQTLKVGETYTGILGVKAYCAQTQFATLNQLLALPGKFILSQVFMPADKSIVLSQINKQNTRLKNANDLARTQIAQIQQAQDQVASGEIAYGEHCLSLMCIANDAQTLEKLLANADAKLIDVGIHAIREDLNLEMAYLAAIPGHQHFLTRKSLLSTRNMADLCTFNNHYRGEAKGSIWGHPVSLLSSKNGNNIYFNFHIDKVGSTAIYGQTGTGKTLLTDFLLAQSTKFIEQGLRVFFFDYLRGSEPFIRALKGDYVRIGVDVKAFNPLQMPDTPQNRKDLTSWLSLLLSPEGETLTAEDRSIIHDAIETIFDNPIEHRNLTELAPSLKLPHLKQRLALWYGQGSHHDYFGANADQFSLNGSIIGMDMTVVLKDDLALAPTLFYLLMRIRYAMQQTEHAPFIIVLEEGWSLLRSKMFRHILEEWILTIRRQNGIVIFLTQNPEQLNQYAELSEIINSNVQTKIFFPNHQASKKVYCELLGLTEYEHYLIKSTPKSSHYFLLKQAEHSCLATIPLAGLEDYICVLSGDMKKALLLDEIRRDLGNDVEKWLPVFVNKCREGQHA